MLGRCHTEIAQSSIGYNFSVQILAPSVITKIRIGIKKIGVMPILIFVVAGQGFEPWTFGL